MRALAVALIGLAGCSTAGSSSPDPNAAAESAGSAGTPPSLDFQFEVIAELDRPPGNIAVGPDGTVYVTLHQFFGPEYPVATVSDGATKRALEDVELDSPLGIAVDEAGTVWALDNGLASGTPPRLVARGNNGVTREYDLSSATLKGSFVNDLVIDLAKRAAYIADPASGSDAALIVLDLASGKARRLLEGHESVIPDPNLDLVIDGVPVTMKQGDSYLKPKIGVNPIATDADKEWLYFGAMHGTQMYRIKTSALRDPSLGAVELRNQIARFGAKPICDGIAVDSDGNLYLGDLANNAIGVIRSDGSYQELVRDPRLSWVDAFAVGPNQMIYAVTNQLQRSPILNQGTSTAQPPFFVVKFSPIGVR